MSSRPREMTLARLGPVPSVIPIDVTSFATRKKGNLPYFGGTCANIVKVMKTQGLLPLLVLVSLAYSYLTVEGSENQVKEDLLRNIVQQATENEIVMDHYGYDVNMMIRWLKRDGGPKKTELRNYRTAWIDEKSRLELYRINDRPLTFSQRKKEEQNKIEWRKALHNGQKKVNATHRLPFSWIELVQKYDFEIVSHDKSAAYVLAFTHKKTKLSERNRVEKVLNHLDGKVWVDEKFRIVKVQANLGDGVNFGFGLAKVTNLDLHYTQMPYDEFIVPASLQLNLRVKALFIYSERREITCTFENYHLNPAMKPSTTPVALEASASR